VSLHDARSRGLPLRSSRHRAGIEPDPNDLLRPFAADAMTIVAHFDAGELTAQRRPRPSDGRCPKRAATWSYRSCRILVGGAECTHWIFMGMSFPSLHSITAASTVRATGSCDQETSSYRFTSRSPTSGA
jgi:hypothetical protein